MELIESHEVVNAIDEFLAAQLAAKLESELKKRDKLNKSGPEKNAAELAKIQQTIDQKRERYSKSVWMADAAGRMAGGLKFGTHTSKGVHPDAKGDNVNFQCARQLPPGIIGSQLVHKPELDANGNAAYLPLAAFFNITVKGVKLRELIQQQHPSLQGAFADSVTLSDSYLATFKATLDNVTEQPTTHERNKQLLWPMANAIKNDNYTCLVPLYPSSLTHAIFHKINAARYSEENKKARENHKKYKENRKNQSIELASYVSIVDLAAISLGGSNQQNVGSLNTKQGGRHFLLPSLPPSFTRNNHFTLNKRQSNFFNKSLRYHCYSGFKALFAAIDQPRNTIQARDQRKQALDMILAQVLSLAQYIQQHYAPGWSVDYDLVITQKYWLDPYRCQRQQQDDFANNRQSSDWINSIQEHFSTWLNAELRKQYPTIAQQFDDAEFFEWQREMAVAIKASQREGQEVFL